MEQLSESGDKIYYKVTSCPTVATMKPELQVSDIRALEDWHDPVSTAKPAHQENKDPEEILPDCSYLNSESESESESEVEVTVTMETVEWNSKIRPVGREQLTSVLEASVDSSIDIEDFSLKTEPEEDLDLFVEYRDRDREEDTEMVMGRIQELTSNQGDDVFQTDGLTSDDQDELTAAEQCGQESSSKRKAEEFLCEENTCRITDGSNGNLCRSPEKDTLVHDPENDEILKQNERTSKEQNICIIGVKDLPSGNNSKVHNIVYSNKTPFKCDLHRKEIPKSSNEGHHTSVLTGETPNCECRKEKCYQCQCSRHIFTEKNNICQHIQNSNLKQRLYECHHCGQVFEHKSNMKHHVKSVHLKMKPHKCPNCGKKLDKKCGLKNHVQTVYLKKKQYECKQCGKRVDLKCDLYKHIRCVHLKEKQFECEHCGKKFHENCDNNKHIQIMHLENNNMNVSNIDRGLL